MVAYKAWGTVSLILLVLENDFLGITSALFGMD